MLTRVVDGFRIDAAKHVAKPFWTQFQAAAGVYTVGEALEANASLACPFMSQALSGVLNYPMFACSQLCLDTRMLLTEGCKVELYKHNIPGQSSALSHWHPN
jgi:hypothetical protein